MIIIVRRLIRQAWSRYRWEDDLSAVHDLLARPLSRQHRTGVYCTENGELTYVLLLVSEFLNPNSLSAV